MDEWPSSQSLGLTILRSWLEFSSNNWLIRRICFLVIVNSNPCSACKQLTGCPATSWVLFILLCSTLSFVSNNLLDRSTVPEKHTFSDKYFLSSFSLKNKKFKRKLIFIQNLCSRRNPDALLTFK